MIVGLAAKGGSGHGWAGAEILIPFAQGRSAGFEVDQIAKGDPVKAGGKSDMADGDRMLGIKMCFEIVEGFDQFGFLSVGQGRIAQRFRAARGFPAIQHPGIAHALCQGMQTQGMQPFWHLVGISLRPPCSRSR